MCTFYSIFRGQKRLFRSFVHKILTLCTVSIQELWWCAYGIWKDSEYFWHNKWLWKWKVFWCIKYMSNFLISDQNCIECGTWNSNLQGTLMSKQWRKNCRAQNDATPALDLWPFFYKMKPQFKLKSISFFIKTEFLYVCYHI